MLAVEIAIQSEDALIDAMAAMRQWLDHRRFEPASFRCAFAGAGVFCGVDFPKDTEAEELARAFAGRLVAVTALAPPFDEIVGGEAPA